MYLPEQDRVSQSRQYLLSNICTLFAGRIAEDLAFGTDKVTTGASNDIERATDIARKMITRWGFSKRLPPIQYEKDNETAAYLGGGSTQMIPVSEDTRRIIDDEVTEIINSCYQKASEILKSNMDILESMKDALLKYETLDALQIDDLMARKPVREPTVDYDPAKNYDDHGSAKKDKPSEERNQEDKAGSSSEDDASKTDATNPSSSDGDDQKPHQ